MAANRPKSKRGSSSSPIRRVFRRLARLERIAEQQDRIDPPPATPFREWAHKYLSHYFELAPSIFHEWISSEEVLGRLHMRRGEKRVIQAPRGAAKSTWSTQAYPLYCAAHQLEPYIIISADSSPQAEKYLQAIRDEIESNDLLRRDYPQLRPGEKWTTDALQIRNGVRIECVSTGQKIRGRKQRQHRPSLIIVDDPQNLEHLISELKRNRSMDWMKKDVVSAGNQQTNIVLLGTALHEQAIVCQLTNSPGWDSSVWRSLGGMVPNPASRDDTDCLPGRLDLWQQVEDIWTNYDLPENERDAKATAFFEANREQMSANGKGEPVVVLWPERENLYSLMKMRASIGEGAFGSEKQNNPHNPELAEWPEKYFNWPGFWYDTLPPLELQKRRVISADPSKVGTSLKHDYAAFSSITEDYNGVFWIEVNMERRPVEKLCADLCKQQTQFVASMIVIETNVHTSLIKLPLEEAARGLRIMLPKLVKVEATEKKEFRMLRLGPLLAQRKLRFKAKCPGTALAVQQMKDIPHGSHDDGPDCIIQGIDAMGKPAWELKPL